MKTATILLGLFLLSVNLPIYPDDNGSAPQSASKLKIRLLAIFKNKVIARVNGERVVLVKDKPGPYGITLRFSDTRGESADLEINGKLETMPLGYVMSDTNEQSAGPGRETVTLFSNANGFFHADGYINNRPVTFLVDTGANTIAMNSATANRIGINYREGQKGIAATASGYAEIFMVTLEEVEVGGLSLRQVEASIIEGPQPDVPLLGMSFLSSFNMKREGNRMQLMQR